MHERRKLKRKHLRHHLMIFDRNTDEITGYLVDLTPEGVMLTSKSPVKIGATFNLRMALPDKIRGSWRVAFDARSVWSRKDAITGFYKTGFRVLELTNGNSETIQILLNEFGAQGRSGLQSRPRSYSY